MLKSKPEKRLKITLLIILLASPLLLGWHPTPTLGTISDVWSTFIVGIVVSAVLVIYFKKLSLAITPLSVALLALIAVTLIQPLVIRFEYSSFWLSPLCLLILGLLLHQIMYCIDEARRQNWLFIIAAVILLSALVNGFIGFAQMQQWESLLTLFDDRVFYWDSSYVYPTGNIAQKNILATLSILGAAASVLVIRDRSTLWHIIILLFLFYITAATGSRTPLAVMLGLSVLLLVNFIFYRLKPPRIIMELVVCLLLMQFLTPYINSVFANLSLLEGAVDRMGGGVYVRLYLIKSAFAAGLENPVLGVGWNNFSHFQMLYTLENGGWSTDSLASHAHNLFLHLAAETGWITTLILLVITAIFVVRPIKNNPAYLFALICFTTLMVHSLLEYPLWKPMLLFILVIVLVEIESQQHLEKKVALDFKGNIYLRLGLCGVVSIIAIASLVSTVQLVKISSDWNRISSPYLSKTEGEGLASFWLTSPVVEPYSDWVRGNNRRLPVDERIRFLTKTEKWLPDSFVMVALRNAYAEKGDVIKARYYQSVIADIYTKKSGD